VAAGRDQDTLNLPSRYSGSVCPEPPSSAGTSLTGSDFLRAATEPLHCVYGSGLGVIAQGSKQVLLGTR
jgi:hypothetical protein